MDLREVSKAFSLPYEEVENLFLHYTKIPRYRLYSSPPTNQINEEFLSLLEKKKAGYPTQYLTRTAFFLDLELYVDERVFIPRPETEGLVILISQSLPQREPLRFLEIGTGSGNIAISLARLFPRAEIIATDISESALSVARINILRYKLAERVRLVKSDLFSAPEIKSSSFDLLVSNPPYIPTEEIGELDKGVKEFEPKIALDGGPDGCLYLKRIIEEGRRYLKPGGKIFLEIDPRARERILSLEGSAQFYPDLSGSIRYAVLSPNSG
jgi:release factor glutamine methyltransferase